jgi:hypothetical protein
VRGKPGARDAAKVYKIKINCAVLVLLSEWGEANKIQCFKQLLDIGSNSRHIGSWGKISGKHVLGGTDFMKAINSSRASQSNPPHAWSRLCGAPDEERQASMQVVRSNEALHIATCAHDKTGIT